MMLYALCIFFGHQGLIFSNENFSNTPHLLDKLFYSKTTFKTGDTDGYSDQSLTNSNYSDSDGYSDQSLTNSSYSDSDGYSDQSLTNSSYSDSDGYSDQSLTNSSYSDSDGYSDQSLTNSSYSDSDGYSDQSLTNSSYSDSDGYSDQSLTNSSYSDSDGYSDQSLTNSSYSDTDGYSDQSLTNSSYSDSDGYSDQSLTNSSYSDSDGYSDQSLTNSTYSDSDGYSDQSLTNSSYSDSDGYSDQRLTNSSYSDSDGYSDQSLTNSSYSDSDGYSDQSLTNSSYSDSRFYSGEKHTLHQKTLAVTSPNLNSTFPQDDHSEFDDYLDNDNRILHSNNVKYFNISDNHNNTSMMLSDHDETDMTSTETYQHLNSDPCLAFSTCKPQDKEDWYCQCDEFCPEYRDCCHSSNYTIDLSAPTKYSCMKLGNLEKDFSGIQVIDKCLQDTSSHDISKCNDDDIVSIGPPVVSNDNPAMIYKNRYCALCNDVTSFTFFDMAIPINRNMKNISFSKSEVLRKIDYHYKYIPPQFAHLRLCLVFNDDETNYELCQKYINPIIVDMRTLRFYRNAHCLKFNGSVGGITEPYCLASLFELDRFDDGRDPLQSISVIFSFDKDALSGASKTSSCIEWSKQIQDQKECTHVPTFINFEVKIEFIINFPDNYTEAEILQVVLLTLWVKEVPNLSVVFGTTHKTLSLNHKNVIKISSGIKITKRSFERELAKYTANLKTQKIRVIIMDDETSFTIKTQDLETTNLDYKWDKKYLVLDPNKLSIYHEKYDLIIPHDISVKRFCSEPIIRARKHMNNALEVFNLQCEKLPRVSKSISILALLTYILCSISVISLIILIVFNRKHKLYVDVPSSNTENIAVSLTFANILFMAGIKAPSFHKICYIISILLHYVWLATFSFTTLAVVYIVSTLLRMKARRMPTGNVKSRERKLMTLVGLVLPLLFVGPAITIDHVGPAYLSPGYDQGVCFPTKFPGNVIFFTGPVMASIFINTVCLLSIIIKLQVMSMELSQIRRSPTYDDAKMYLRMLVLSGIFWITGVLAVLFQLEWLDYIFTFTCGLHGFFISVANLTTRRIKSFRKQTKISTPIRKFTTSTEMTT